MRTALKALTWKAFSHLLVESPPPPSPSVCWMTLLLDEDTITTNQQLEGHQTANQWLERIESYYRAQPITRLAQESRLYRWLVYFSVSCFLLASLLCQICFLAASFRHTFLAPFTFSWKREDVEQQWDTWKRTNKTDEQIWGRLAWAAASSVHTNHRLLEEARSGFFW